MCNETCKCRETCHCDCERKSRNELLVKKLDEKGIVPGRSHDGDAGFDFFLPDDMTIQNASISNKIGLHIAVCVPRGYFMAIVVRSSTGAKMPLRLSNSFGVVDEGYRGELCLLIDNISQYEDVELKRGQRIAQGMILPVPEFEIKEVDELPESERGNGGFGSTGR